MAVRLSVVMVHSPPPSAVASGLAESAVGQLIGLPEIDLTLVGPLSQLADGSTDRLSLESLSGDVAVLDWRTPAEIIGALGVFDFDGDRAPHPHDRDAPGATATSRRIYAFDLNQFTNADSLCEAIGQLKSGRQVRTFSLGIGPAPGAGKKTLPQATAPIGPTGKSPTTGSKDEETAPAAPSAPKPSPIDAAGELDLDQLLDQLDALDP